MLATLDLKILQMLEAMGAMRPSVPDAIKPESGEIHGASYRRFDFNQNRSDAELRNVASLLLANIGCLKDHLKVWCEKNRVPFEGEALINSNREVALVHDLWNTDKHASLDRSRSRFKPRLVNLRQGLSMSAGSAVGGKASIQIELASGNIQTTATGGGTASMIVNAQIVDEDGTYLGEFCDICDRAVTAWWEVLVKAGVNLPSSAD